MRKSPTTLCGGHSLKKTIKGEKITKKKLGPWGSTDAP